MSHGVRFVQDDELIRWARICLAVTGIIYQLASWGFKGHRIAYEEIPACLGVSLANVLIFSLTTEIPRSSDALSSNTRDRNRSGLHDMYQPASRSR